HHYLSARELRKTEKAVASALHHDSAGALSKLTEVVDGQHRIVTNPPLIVPMRDLLSRAEWPTFEANRTELLDRYSHSLPYDRRVLFEQFRFVELARKVVGVGSVGTRCWIGLFEGADNNDPLFLQFKEAQASVLERFTGTSEYSNHAERVVAG